MPEAQPPWVLFAATEKPGVAGRHHGDWVPYPEKQGSSAYEGAGRASGRGSLCCPGLCTRGLASKCARQTAPELLARLVTEQRQKYKNTALKAQAGPAAER